VEVLLTPARGAQGRRAIGPLDGPAADLADGQRRVVVTKQAADEGIGEEEGVTVAPTPASDESIHRVKVTA
jgi:hypothetical protein